MERTTVMGKWDISNAYKPDVTISCPAQILCNIDKIIHDEKLY